MSIANLFKSTQTQSNQLAGRITPTIISNSGNFSVNETNMNFHRIGNIVFISGQILLTTTDSNQLDLQVSLPIEPTNNFDSVDQIIGISFFNNNSAALQFQSGSKNCRIIIDSGITGLDNISFNGSYIINF